MADATVRHLADAVPATVAAALVWWLDIASSGLVTVPEGQGPT